MPEPTHCVIVMLLCSIQELLTPMHRN